MSKVQTLDCPLDYRTCGYCGCGFSAMFPDGVYPVCRKNSGFFREVICSKALSADEIKPSNAKNKSESPSLPDTHGEDGEGWIGFDLDGTLAKYDGWHGIDHIGEPIKPMVELITKLHKQGRRVKIFTARIAPHKLEDGTFGESYITVPKGEKGATKQYAFQYINDWCHFNLGFVPEIVYKKDHLMLELYDDRTKQVEPNTGIVIEDELARLRERLTKYEGIKK